MANNPSEAPSTTHRGVLCNLTDEERGSTVRAYLLAHYAADFGESQETRLAEMAQTGEPVNTLSGMLDALTRDQLLEMARDYNLKGYSKLKKADLIDVVGQVLAQDHIDLFLAATHCDDKSLESLRRVSDAGGTLTLKPDEVGLAGPMAPLPPYLCLYNTFDGFVFIIPEELRPLVASAKWEVIEAERMAIRDVVDFAESLTERCGVVEVADAIELFAQLFGSEVSPEDFVTFALAAIADESAGYGYWELNEVPYLVNFELDDANVSPDDADGLKNLEGFRQYLVKKHAERPIGPLPEDLYDMPSFECVVSQPSGIALRNFFDAHVPDGEDDYAYADRMVENIADLNGNLVSFEETVRDLDQANLGLSADERAEMLPLLRAFLDDIPYWENNGWTNNQVRAESGAKVFYNADGTDMKVGRNDPCPCGSGKKYKKCCGANK